MRVDTRVIIKVIEGRVKKNAKTMVQKTLKQVANAENEISTHHVSYTLHSYINTSVPKSSLFPSSPSIDHVFTSTWAVKVIGALLYARKLSQGS